MLPLDDACGLDGRGGYQARAVYCAAMSESFRAELTRLLDDLIQGEREERRRDAEREERFKRAVQRFRDLAAGTIRPVLEEVAEPLRARGLQPFVGDNTRFGMSCWLDVEADSEPARGLAFRLDADRGAVEAVLHRTAGNTKIDEKALAEVDREWVQQTLLTFVRKLYAG